ncbi:unnamed protein product [Rotaria socialis]|uniref:Uncharacterized protein n=1 Tax=Rotaria socialis TaxID=392032 RepID=A0A818ZF55_9BILA|nr:unnamed protein product [Rotaria socialis]
MEDVRVISLGTVSDDATKCIQTNKHILEINPAALNCVDYTQCINFMNSVRDEKVIFIIWNGCITDILSKFHDCSSLFAVFLYSKKRSYVHDKLRSQYSKIVDVFDDENALIGSVRNIIQSMARIAIAVSLFDQKQKSIRDLTKNSASFIWYQLLINVLKDMIPDAQSKNNMLATKLFIWWYSDECFLYKLLNRGLRTEDIDLLYSFRFFIIDLSTALENECQKLKQNGWVTVYRGQRLSNTDFEELHASIGIIITFNGFLSTSRDINVALRFAHKCAAIGNDFKICLIEICVNPSLDSVVAADIEQFSKMKGEKEVLFGLATDEGAERTHDYIQAQKEMMKEYSPLIGFGRLLWNELGQIDRAEKYFKNLLQSVPPDHPDIADIYNSIGCVYAKKGVLDQALKNYNEAYEIRKRKLQETDPKIAGSLHNIAVIYRAQSEIDRALDYFLQALTIHEKNYDGDHEDKGYTIESIGLVYKSKCKFDTALIWLSRALGNIYEEKNELDRALDYYYCQLEMEEKCLPPDHSRLLKHLDWITRIYCKKHGKEKALTLYQEKLTIQRTILNDNHPNIALRLMKIGDFLKRHEEYYGKALKILEKCSPPDLLLKINCLDTLSTVALSQNDFQLALTHQQDILETCSRVYEPNHPNFPFRLQKIGDIYFEKLHNYQQALYYYSEALSMYQIIYHSRRKELFDIQNKIRKVQQSLAGDNMLTKQDDNHDDEFSLFD